jgi:glycosyltransferase involved in cell wall biosynthesis
VKSNNYSVKNLAIERRWSNILRLTIGIPVYQQYIETWFTVQSLRLHHNLKDCEILLIDNFGDEKLERFAKTHGDGLVRYVKRNEVQGTGWVKNRVFEHAQGDTVVCIDSHVLIAPGSLDSIKPTEDLMFGVMLMSNMKTYYTEYLPQWRGQSWGIWGPAKRKEDLPNDPFDIWGMGTAGFYCNKKAWLGFHDKARGFGGIEGVIVEKYRKAGRKVLCNPKFIWHHYFRPDEKIKDENGNEKTVRGIARPPYPLHLIDRVKNYILGFMELNMDLAPIRDHYKVDTFNKALEQLKNEGLI